MKRLLFVALAFFALSCGDDRNRSNRDQSGANQDEQYMNENETARPDTTDTETQPNIGTEGNEESRDNMRSRDNTGAGGAGTRGDRGTGAGSELESDTSSNLNNQRR